MSLSKITLLAAGLALALSTTSIVTKANAQAPQNTPRNMLEDIGEDEAFYMSPAGKIQKAKKKIAAEHHTKAMASGGREISRGAMIYRKGGKIYLLENKPGKAAGKTMIQEDFQDHFDQNL